MGVARFWREIPARYNLIGNKCKCGALYFPPKEVCSECLSPEQTEFQFSGEGKIVTYTVIHIAQEGFEKQVPYVIAVVELDEGPRLTGQIVDCKLEDVKIGQKVYSVFRKIGEDGKAGAIYYGYKFRLRK